MEELFVCIRLMPTKTLIATTHAIPDAHITMFTVSPQLTKAFARTRVLGLEIELASLGD
jgi:hypothetical protein